MDPDNLLDELILDGSIEVSSVDPRTGNFLYSFSKNLETNNPELYHSVMEAINVAIMSLWEKGFIEMDLSEKDPTVFLTEKGTSEENLNTLNSLEFGVLESIITQLEQDQ